mgnify:CR=1 FL=1
MKFGKKALGRVLSGVLAAGILVSSTACGGPAENTNASAGSGSAGGKPPLLTLNLYDSSSDSIGTYAKEADDVVAKYILDKFNIKIGKTYANEGMTKKERINLFVASGTLPDICYDINDNSTFPSTGLVADLTDLIPKYCPNLMKIWPQNQWKFAEYNGRLYCFPNPLKHSSDPKYKDDVYTSPGGNWAGISTTENTLRKCGYSFTPWDKIVEKINTTQKKPTEEDFAITPAIKTPEDFEEFLKKIRTVYGSDVIPFDTWIALEPHMGTMFGLTCGQWAYDEKTQTVFSGFAAPNAKKYWQWFNRIYTEGLLNPDFAVEKDEQRQENIVNGKIKTWMFESDITAIQTAVKKRDPNDSVHMIPLPQEEGTTNPGIDVASTATFRLYINKNFSDIPRLLKFFDWTQSDEFSSLCNWGTAELGLYTTNSEGKKVYKNNDIYLALKNGDSDKQKQYLNKYGLMGNTIFHYFYLPASGSGYDPQNWQRSYKFSATNANPQYLRAFISDKGLNWTGTLLNGVDDVTQAANNWYAQTFEQQLSPKLFAAKNSEEFDKAWDTVMKDWDENSKYAEAQKEMEQEFAKMGFSVKSASPK